MPSAEVTVCGESKNVVIITQQNDVGNIRAPDWALDWVLGILIPRFIKNMLRDGASQRDPRGQHVLQRRPNSVDPEQSCCVRLTKRNVQDNATMSFPMWIPSK